METLRQNDTGVTQAILFGSHARWDADDESDINVAIISPDLGRDRLEEGVRLKLLTERVDTSISSRTRSVARGKRAMSALPNLAWAGWGRCYLRLLTVILDVALDSRRDPPAALLVL